MAEKALASLGATIESMRTLYVSVSISALVQASIAISLRPMSRKYGTIVSDLAEEGQIGKVYEALA